VKLWCIAAVGKAKFIGIRCETEKKSAIGAESRVGPRRATLGDANLNANRLIVCALRNQNSLFSRPFLISPLIYERFFLLRLDDESI
jgi:hypothetical protein